ncbi:sensor domain-containing protein [Halorientalis pallida]|uniref:Histidine kinase n=1 Tax=Halorientalis pallida TaxID=2479928 RepID=A0A498L2C9_9EURY|nr:sensor domain-containing protein [Halorientalis pallida]RXK49034.1 histidine kinase [Halorientalis pallida]
MPPDVRSRTPALSFPSVRSALTAPLRLQSYKNFVYLWLAFPLGVVYLTVLVTAFAISASLLVLVVGVPLLLGCLLVTLVLGRVELALSGWLLDVPIPVPSYDYLFEGSPVERASGLVTDVTVWTTLFYLGSKFVYGTVAFAVLSVPSVISGTLLTAPLYYDEPGVTVGVQLTEPIRLTPSLSLPWNELAVGVETMLRVTSWQVETPPEALLASLAGLVAAVLVFNLSNGLARAWALYSRYVLGDSNHDDAAA